MTDAAALSPALRAFAAAACSATLSALARISRCNLVSPFNFCRFPFTRVFSRSFFFAANSFP